MSNDDLWLLVGGAALLGIAAYATGAFDMSGPWSDLPNYQTWAANISAAEQANGLPSGLLAAVCYQESGYQDSVIDGTQPSSAGALGIAQLEPAYFSSVQVAVPFQPADIANQINQAGAYLGQLYQQFGDWPDAIAAYNAGPTTVQNVQNGSQSALPQETQAYVAAITGNVPGLA